jgi:HD-like signal output (HDOD) protein
MSTEPRSADAGDENGLVVHLAGDPQLVKYLSLVLSYLYGLNIVVARSLAEASSLLLERGSEIRCVFLVHGQRLTSQTSITALGIRGQIPVFLLIPAEHLDHYRSLCEGQRNVFLYPWEEVTAPVGRSLREVIDDAFERNDIGGLFDGARHLSYRVLQQRVQRRLRRLSTLPTLPEVVARVMQAVNDPDTSNEQLEELLLSDSAVVHKLVQVVNTPLFAGSGQKERWALSEGIRRLGRRKIGSIALQIKLINSLVKPEDSQFDLRRFWVHSVGTAMIADRIYQGRLVALADWDACGEYWIASLLHDVGKLTLGFFFWSYFDCLQNLVGEAGISFREAEVRLGDAATHEQVGQLLLIRAGLGREVVMAVGSHHEPGVLPGPLVCLVHLANNLCKDLGKGYTPDERGVYSPSVLQSTALDEAGLARLREELSGAVAQDLEDLVSRCMG